MIKRRTKEECMQNQYKSKSTTVTLATVTLATVTLATVTLATVTLATVTLATVTLATVTLAKKIMKICFITYGEKNEK